MTDTPPSTSPAPSLINDCFRPAEQRLRHADALALLRARATPVVGQELCSLSQSVGRVLSAPVSAPHPLPLHTNAAVDGYGVIWSPDLQTNGGTFDIVGRAAAGHPYTGHLASEQAVHILTGAIVPDSVTSIVMQEDVRTERGPSGESRDGSRVVLPVGVKAGSNIRKAGEDVAAGAEMFAPGHIIRPQDLAALASAGAHEVTCFKRLRIGVISTGDEVVPADGRSLVPGQVFDANSPMLEAFARNTGAEVETFGIWPDDGDEILARLQAAAAQCDVLLTSGGASQGQEDHMAASLDALGSRHMWQLAIKPGRPLMFGQIGQTVVVGLPGNPVAVCVCFLLYVVPLLRVLSGAGWREPKVYPVPAGFSVAKRKLGRREFWRAALVTDDRGVRAMKFPNDGSGLITGLRVSDGLIDVSEDTPAISEGDLVRFIPFSQFGVAERG